MISLYGGLGALLVLAVALVLWSLRRPPASLLQSTHQTAQRGFYAQRRKEIAEDYAEGLIDDTQRAELENELDRQVLEETQSEPEQAGVARLSPLLLPGLILAMVITAGLIYQRLGYRDDLLLKDIQEQIVAGESVDEALIERYQAVLAGLVEKRPDNDEYLMTMAGLLRQKGDFAAAVPYFERLLEHYPNDAELMAQLAQARYLAAGRRLDSETRALLDRAIALEPQQPTALGVLGIDAYANADYLAALAFWQKLVGVLPPGSSQQVLIASGIDEAKRRALAAGSLFGIPVEIDFKVDGTGSGGMLFVVAKEPEGMPMPVAAIRLPLPDRNSKQVYFTNGDVIREGKTLTDFPRLSISAHISFSGTAMRRPGDWGSEPVLVDTLEGEPVKLLIDQQF